MRTDPCHHGLTLLWTILYLGWIYVEAVKRENRCMKHYFVHTIEHPSKNCEKKNILLTRCEGMCKKSRTMPKISFSPVIYNPFKYSCKCCRDKVSVMKAVKLRCRSGRPVYATYRFIVSCECDYCDVR